MKTIRYECAVDRTTYIYIKLYLPRPNNVSPHVLSPPPFTAYTGEQLQLALEVRDVKTSDRELLTPSTLPQMSTLATNSANV